MQTLSLRCAALSLSLIASILLSGATRTLAQTHQAPAIEWQKSLGGGGDEGAHSIQQTSDGGFIVAGWSLSNDSDVTGNHGREDYWIVRLTSTGAVEWQKSLGGSYDDRAHSIQQTNDGGFIVAGESWSNDSDVTGHHGSTNYTDDYWIVRLSSAGDIQWQKSLGGSRDDQANSIQQTNDGGFIVAGSSGSSDGDVTGHHGDSTTSDYWIVKLTSVGNIEWQKSLGGNRDDWATSIQQTSDSGFVVAGYSTSNDGDVTGNHGGRDYSIIKLTSAGNIEWQKSLGGSGEDEAQSIRQTRDGGFVVSGWSWSYDGDVTENHGERDYWIVKLSSTGYVEWQKSLGGSSDDYASSIQQTRDGGFIVAGRSYSNNGDVTGHHGSAIITDCWIVKLSGAGVIEWEKSLGGNDFDLADAIQQTSDGGFVLAGSSNSTDGDVTGNHGGHDYWIVKLAPEASGVASDMKQAAVSLECYPNPFGTIAHITAPGARSVSIVNSLGVRVATLAAQAAGEFVWSPGAETPDGTYWVVAQGNNGSSAKPMTLLR